MRQGHTPLLLLAAVVALPIAVAQVPSAGMQADPAEVADRERVPSSSVHVARAQRGDDDARHCLDFPANPQVIACAEQYRPDRRRT